MLTQNTATANGDIGFPSTPGAGRSSGETPPGWEDRFGVDNTATATLLDGNAASGNQYGFEVYRADGNFLAGNRASDNAIAGFSLSGAARNVLERTCRRSTAAPRRERRAGASR